MGDEGAGHFVKMVHNGIEYGDMQVICEAYDLMKNCLRMSPDEIGKVLASDISLNDFLSMKNCGSLAFSSVMGDRTVLLRLI